MRILFRSMVAAAALVGVSCQSTTEPVTPPEEISLERTAASLNLEASKFRGRPDILVGKATTDAGGVERVVEVLAVNTRLGAFGRYRVTLPSLDLFFTVDVTCVSTEKKTAWVGGIISDTNADFIEVGSISYMYAIDNQRGRRGGGTPDVVSAARFNDLEGQDLLFCEEQTLLLPGADVIAGGVRVR